MKQKQDKHYTIQREFLSKYSAKELVIRIIKSHMNEDKKEK